jgi:hypothetical protein
MPSNEYPFERKHFRIVFPPSERPRLVAPDGTRHVVMDCSETGFRYRPHGAELPEFGTSVEGVLHFRGGRRVAVVGTVVRHHEGDAGVELAGEGIPFPALWAEQRRLRRRASRQAGVVAG